MRGTGRGRDRVALKANEERGHFLGRGIPDRLLWSSRTEGGQLCFTHGISAQGLI